MSASCSLGTHPTGSSVNSREALSSINADRRISPAKRGTGAGCLHLFLRCMEKIPVIGAAVSFIEAKIDQLQTQKKAPPEKLRFTFEDLQKLTQGRFGLRHISSQEAFEKESQEGVKKGCSVNLSPHLLLEKRGEEESQIAKDFREDPEFGLFSFEAGVEAFIKGSLSFDGLWVSDKRTLEESLKTTNTSRFLLVRYEGGDDSPDSFSSWGEGLGRVNKEDIPKERVLSIVPLISEDFASEEERADYPKKEKVDDVIRSIIDRYRTQLIRTIRENSSFFVDKTPHPLYDKLRKKFLAIIPPRQ